MNRHASRSPGFTLIETLVTIAVIALLVSILVPALAGTRDRARRLASEANLRSIGQLFEVYAGDDGGYPAPTPGELYPTFRPDVRAAIGHWDASDRWPGLLADLAPWWSNTGVYLSPGAVRDVTGSVIALPTPSYVYSASFLGDPRLWGPTPPADPPRLRRGTSRHEVAFPSQKALAWDWELAYVRRELRRSGVPPVDLDEPTPVLFADGHTRERNPSEASDPHVCPDLGATHPTERLHNTPVGVRGVDYSG